MSVIPPNWLASVLGAAGAQKSASAAREKESAAQAENSAKADFADKLHDVIENADRDGQVYADAEGLGSQGRPFTGESEEQNRAQNAPTDAPEGGLDVQA